MGASETYERIKDEGVAEGERRILLRLLEKRFGPLPQRIVARVHAADAAQLERWAEQIMSAASPEQVIES